MLQAIEGVDTHGMHTAYDRLRQREKRRNSEAATERDEHGLPIMTPVAIREAAIEDGGYETPELNDRLYLHFKGYRRVENLEPYTEIKALWLGSNGLSEVEGISHMKNLRCLYMQNNLITSLADGGLAGLEQLVQLDLSNNRLVDVVGLEVCPKLHTVNVAKNALSTGASIAHFAECPALTNVDLSGNNLEGNEVFETLKTLPLVALTISGNPIVTAAPHFRKRLLHALPSLRYLDRPVFEQERVGVAAWAVGGAEGEAEARREFAKRKVQKDKESLNEFREWQAEQRRKKMEEIEERRRQGLPDVPPPTEEELALEAKRKAEAHAEAELEKRMINEVGVAKIAARFWANGSDKSSGRAVEDDLMAAAKQELDKLDREKEAAAAAAAAAEQRRVNEEEGEEEEDGNSRSSSRAAEEGVFPPSPPPEEKESQKASRAIEESEAAVAVAAAGRTFATGQEEAPGGREDEKEEVDVAGNEEKTEATEQAEEDEDEEAEEHESKDEEAEAERRAQAVYESLQIHRAQMAAEQEQKQRLVIQSQEQQKQVESTSRRLAAPEGEGKEGRAAQGTRGQGDRILEVRKGEAVDTSPGPPRLLWSEWMDHQLARLVRSCTFDFEQVAQTLQKAVDDNQQHSDSAPITTEACRLRWAQLDVESWGNDDDEGDEDDDESDDESNDEEEEESSGDEERRGEEKRDQVDGTNGMNLHQPSPDYMQNLVASAGLSFEQLMQRAGSGSSKLLKRPVNLPSVHDLNTPRPGAGGGGGGGSIEADGGAAAGAAGYRGYQDHDDDDDDDDDDGSVVLSREQMKAIIARQANKITTAPAFMYSGAAVAAAAGPTRNQRVMQAGATAREAAAHVPEEKDFFDEDELD